MSVICVCYYYFALTKSILFKILSQISLIILGSVEWMTTEVTAHIMVQTSSAVVIPDSIAYKDAICGDWV